MTDVAHDDDGDQGDGPDRLDDRLDDIGRLIDALAADHDLTNRALRRVIATRLVAATGRDVLERLAALLDRIEQI